jgi:cytochrome b561
MIPLSASMRRVHMLYVESPGSHRNKVTSRNFHVVILHLTSLMCESRLWRRWRNDNSEEANRMSHAAARLAHALINCR